MMVSGSARPGSRLSTPAQEILAWLESGADDKYHKLNQSLFIN